MQKEPDNQSSGNEVAKIARKTAAAASTFRRGNADPYSDTDPAYHFSYFVQDLLEARLDNACAASVVEHCDPLWLACTVPYFPDIFVQQPTFTSTGGKDIPISATVFNDGACNKQFMIHYEGTIDIAQPVPPSPGMDHDPSATLESSVVLLLSQEPVVQAVDADTSRVTYAAPRDSVEQGVPPSLEEATAKLVALVAIFPKKTNFHED